MDSRSGSLQSSSGGEEEHDSRAAADSVSPFMSSGGGGGGNIPNAPPQQQPFFDPFSNYLQLQNPSPTPSWPRPTFMPSFQPAGLENHHQSTLPPPPQQNQTQPHTAARNPKKRSRASRRAPTTVLTTDTSNFRAMVQEFTGIPAPPFTAAAYPNRRLDLFGKRSASAAPPPQYLRRPFPQKPQPTPLPFLPSAFNSGGGISLDSAAAMAAAAASSSITNNITNSVPSSSPAINNNLFTISNPLLTSFLQTNPKFQNNPPLMSSPKTQNTFEITPNAHQSQPKFMGFDEQFGLSHDHNHVPDQSVAALPNLINSDRNNNNNHHPDRGDTDINLSSINGGGYNFIQSNMTNFHGEKGADNGGGGRGEGMVESWICSSE